MSKLKKKAGYYFNDEEIQAVEEARNLFYRELIKLNPIRNVSNMPQIMKKDFNVLYSFLGNIREEDINYLANLPIAIQNLFSGGHYWDDFAPKWFSLMQVGGKILYESWYEISANQQVETDTYEEEERLI